MKQTTIARPSGWIDGCALTTRKQVRVRFLPSPAGTGVVFRALGESEQDVKCEPRVATFMHRWTSLQDSLRTINHTEHILAALTICGIDNARIEIEGNEIPLVTNGSCRAFVDELKRAGVAVLDEVCTAYELKEPFAVVGDGDRPDSCLLGYPAPELEVSYLFHVPQFPRLLPAIGECCPARGVPAQIIDARTYLLEHEIEAYGGLLNDKVQNMLVVGPGNGQVSCQEAAHHKLLDMMGDLRCLGVPVNGRFIGIRSGHRLNIRAVKHMVEANLLRKVAP